VRVRSDGNVALEVMGLCNGVLGRVGSLCGEGLWVSHWSLGAVSVKDGECL